MHAGGRGLRACLYALLLSALASPHGARGGACEEPLVPTAAGARVLCMPAGLQPRPEVAHCGALNHSWADIIRAPPGRFTTGGLGRHLLEDRFEVWVCDRGRACAAGGVVCYTFSEEHRLFVPWGLWEHVLEPRRASAAGARSAGAVRGRIQGARGAGALTISLGSAHSDGFLRTVTLSSDEGSFAFEEVPLGAVYWLKSEGLGHANRPAQTRNLSAHAPVWEAVLDVGDGAEHRRRLLVGHDPDPPAVSWQWEWALDASRAGCVTESATVVAAPSITYLEDEIEISDDQAAWKLAHEYGILLARESQWTSEFAGRLLDTVSTVPLRAGARSYYSSLDLSVLPLLSVWSLERRVPLHNDISIGVDAHGMTRVNISADAFTYAAPQKVIIDGVVGKYFSKRLYHALVRFVTNDAADYAAAEHILSTRFGTRSVLSDATISALTAPTTAEDAARFQPWTRHPEEILTILGMFEELPSGLHQVPGLAYLLRRADGLDHPLYPAAPAVAWPDASDESYIEFMESAFLSDVRHLRRLVLHEKAHFVWSGVLGHSIRDEWTALGGWYPNADDPDGWSTSLQLQFVSRYAHGKNPNEHFAESLAAYVENPAALLACCAEQYAFIRDRIMHGQRYIPQIAEPYTFEVLNLSPDFVYPGRIVRLRVEVRGLPEEDKYVTVVIWLHTAEGVFAGASAAVFRLFSSIGTFRDVRLACATRAIYTRAKKSEPTYLTKEA